MRYISSANRFNFCCFSLWPVSIKTEKTRQVEEGSMSKRLLVIEDDDDTLALLKEIFSVHEHTVFTASDLDEVQAVLESSEVFDLIISDLAVPGAGRDGEIVKFIRSSYADKTIPILLLSGHADLPQIARSLEVDYLKKPISLHELLKRV